MTGVSELTELSRESICSVRRHLNTLVEQGLIGVSDVEKRRGVAKRYYVTKMQPWLTEEAEAHISGPARRKITLGILRDLLNEATDALNTGVMALRTDRVVTNTPTEVDSRVGRSSPGCIWNWSTASSTWWLQAKSGSRRKARRHLGAVGRLPISDGPCRRARRPDLHRFYARPFYFYRRPVSAYLKVDIDPVRDFTPTRASRLSAGPPIGIAQGNASDGERKWNSPTTTWPMQCKLVSRKSRHLFVDSP
jgi:DNA-binding transcriptional ArsR family regulator